jgi:signal transduction histidine kinase/ActR/RegA family two-component response regulator
MTLSADREPEEQGSERVLLTCPAGRDAAMLAEQLGRRGLQVAVCPTISVLCAELKGGAGALFIAEEALYGLGLRAVIQSLEEQPPWSDIPLIVMTETSQQSVQSKRLDDVFRASSNVTLLERPIRLATLFSVVTAALQNRRRQYEVRRLLEETKRAVDQRDRFLAMLGHELRNPLAAMVNAMAVLQAAGLSREDLVHEQHDVLARQSAHMARLVDDLLDVARITSGKIALNLQLLDLRDVVTHAFQTLKATTGDQRHEFAVETPSVPVMVEVDPVRMEQIVTNLLTNAVKYTPEGGRIAVRITDGTEAVLRVADSGEGIPAEMLDRIFQPFTQMSQTLARSRGGLGMGLAVVRSLVEMHHGTVQVKSEGPGKGSEFSVHLPVVEADKKRRAKPAPRSKRVSSTPREVLLVEDNPDSRRALRRLLSIYGHRVVTAEDGPKGLDLATRQKPEIAMLDIGLPGMDGFELGRRLRDLYGKDVFLIALTGYGQPEDRVRALDAGFDLHLVKPVNPDKLLGIISACNSNSHHART